VEREVHSVAGLPGQFADDIYRADRVRLMVRTDAQGRRDRRSGG
jgi:GntR family transcriptional regulator